MVSRCDWVLETCPYTGSCRPDLLDASIQLQQRAGNSKTHPLLHPPVIPTGASLRAERRDLGRRYHEPRSLDCRRVLEVRRELAGLALAERQVDPQPLQVLIDRLLALLDTRHRE